jgi:putative phosphotransacetylase
MNVETYPLSQNVMGMFLVSLCVEIESNRFNAGFYEDAKELQWKIKFGRNEKKLQSSYGGDYMDEEVIQSIVEDVVTQLLNSPLASNEIPISVSARHCHLCQQDVESLFGEGYKLTKKADLSQTGHFAANETVTIIGRRGSIESIRVLGPTRSRTQIEISKTDAIKVGVNPPLRESGDIKGSSPITLLGPKGNIYLKEGLIIAKAHIHMNPIDAKALDVRTGDYVNVMVEKERPITFNKVLVRVSPDFITDMHIDTDEANAGLIVTGQHGKIIKVDES